MTVPVWQPGTVYVPGAVVQPKTVIAMQTQAIPDNDFEGAGTDWDFETGLSIVSGEAFSGSKCVKRVYTGAAQNFMLDIGIACKPGQSITLNGMMKCYGAGDQVGGSVALWFYNSGDSQIAYYPGSEVNVSNGENYRQSTVTATAPADAAFVRCGGVTFDLHTGGVVLFDLLTWNHTYDAPATTSGLIYKATQTDPGVSAGTEPAWPTTAGGTVVDNTVTWTAILDSRVQWTAVPLTKTGGTEPTWPEAEGEFIIDGSIKWECISRRVTDEKCPNTKQVAIEAEKVFAADADIVKYSATIAPLDWSSPDDAGYIASGMHQYGSNDTKVLNIYRGNLVIFSSTSFQNWQVDPDPANITKLDSIEGIGSTYNRAAHPVGNDLFYLAQAGVRSVQVSGQTSNLEAGDVGMPIDPLVREKLADLINSRPLATYWPNTGQYWLMFPDDIPTPSPPGVYPIELKGHLADGVTGDVIDYNYWSVGGVEPKFYEKISGDWPNGVTMDSDANATGIFTTPGTFTRTLQVTDVNGVTDTLEDTTVVTGDALFKITGDMQGGYVGDSVSYQYTVEGGVAPIVVSVSTPALPDGTSTDANGLVTGTFTEPGYFTWTMDAEDDTAAHDTVDDSCTVLTRNYIVGLSNGYALVSADASTWVGRSTGSSSAWECAIGNQDIAVLAVVSQVAISSDRGETWALHSTGLSFNMFDLNYSPYHELFYMVGKTPPKIYSSPDCVTWTDRTPAISSGNGVQGANSVGIIDDAVVVTTGVSGTWRSTDGTTFTKVNSTNGLNNCRELQGVLYAAYGSKVYKSTNKGTSWSLVATHANIGLNNWAASDDEIIVFSAGASSSYNGAYKSTDGLVTLTKKDGRPHGVGTVGQSRWLNGIYLSPALTTQFYTSDDNGETWTAHTAYYSGLSTAATHCCWAGDMR